MNAIRKAVFLTATDRPEYFRRTMESWSKVRWHDDFTFIVRIEPTEKLDQMVEIAESFTAFPIQLHVNPQRLGVGLHHWVAFEEAFNVMFRDYVVSAEDDLLVSDDFLEYHRWAATEYYHDKEIATVTSFSKTGNDTTSVYRKVGFNPLGFGTWWDRWEDFIRDTWDDNYSTFNGYPGNEAGWDWNLSTRVLPSLNKKTIYPDVSRVQNIGVFGVHGTPENFVPSECFDEHRDLVLFNER